MTKATKKKGIYLGKMIEDTQLYGTYPDMDKTVDSANVSDRIRMAQIGYGIDKLKDDKCVEVRLAVAKGDYYPQHFIKDSNSLVRDVFKGRIEG